MPLCRYVALPLRLFFLREVRARGWLLCSRARTPSGRRRCQHRYTRPPTRRPGRRTSAASEGARTRASRAGSRAAARGRSPHRAACAASVCRQPQARGSTPSPQSGRPIFTSPRRSSRCTARATARGARARPRRVARADAARRAPRHPQSVSAVRSAPCSHSPLVLPRARGVRAARGGSGRARTSAPPPRAARRAAPLALRARRADLTDLTPVAAPDRDTDSRATCETAESPAELAHGAEPPFARLHGGRALCMRSHDLAVQLVPSRAGTV